MSGVGLGGRRNCEAVPSDRVPKGYKGRKEPRKHFARNVVEEV